MTISSTRNHSAPPLPPRNNPAQTHTSQAPGKLEQTNGKQQGTTQAAGTSGHVHTPSASAPQDTFTVSNPNAHVGVTGPAGQTRPQAAGNVQASAQIQQTGNGPLAPERAAAVLSFVNQQQGDLLNRIAGGLKTGKLTQEELSPLMESAQKLAHASGEASGKEQFTPDDTKNLSMMLAAHQATVMKALDKPGVFSFFSAFSSKKPSDAQMALAHQVGELGQKVLQGGIRDGDLSKLISQQFGSPAGAGHAVSQPSVAGTGGVAGTSAPPTPAPASTLQQLGGLLQQFSGLVGTLSAPSPQTPTPAHGSVPTHGSVPAQVQQVGGNLSFPPNPAMMSNLTQQHGSLVAKLDEGVNKGRIALEAIGSLRQGLQELGDAIKTTSAKEQITPADLLGLSSLVLKNATNINAAFKQL